MVRAASGWGKGKRGVVLVAWWVWDADAANNQMHQILAKFVCTSTCDGREISLQICVSLAKFKWSKFVGLSNKTWGNAKAPCGQQKTHALLSTGIRCASWGWDGRLPPRMDTVACRCAMSNYDNCACAGMLLLTHGTHHHPRRACARLAGARTTSGYLLPDVR